MYDVTARTLSAAAWAVVFLQDTLSGRSSGFGNGCDDDHSYWSPQLCLWLYMTMGVRMDTTMAMAMLIAMARHGECPTWHLHGIS